MFVTDSPFAADPVRGALTLCLIVSLLVIIKCTLPGPTVQLHVIMCAEVMGWGEAVLRGFSLSCFVSSASTNGLTEQKQTDRHRRQICGYQTGKGGRIN